jgi:hypothetical protein
VWAFNSHLPSGPDQYDELQFRHLDYIVASAAKHNIKLILALGNFWNAYVSAQGGRATCALLAGLLCVRVRRRAKGGTRQSRRPGPPPCCRWRPRTSCAGRPAARVRGRPQRAAGAGSEAASPVHV